MAARTIPDGICPKLVEVLLRLNNKKLMEEFKLLVEKHKIQVEECQLWEQQKNK